MKPYAHTLHLVLTLIIVGCAPYARHTAGIRAAFAAGDHIAADERIDQAARATNRLLFYLEHGMVEHARGNHELSNRYFETAERVADQLYTRSIARETASFLTNDEVRSYRGEEFELVFIHYYRALNYWHLGAFEDALVECRKANLKLAEYTDHSQSEVSYKSDAFIHYLTALMYEATGEMNDAYVSMKHASAGYKTYANRFGVTQPKQFAQDYARVAADFGDEVPPQANQSPAFESGEGELILLSEIGFAPRRTQKELNLPIYGSDIKLSRRGKGHRAATNIVRRHRSRTHHTNVDYWLRIAMPRLESVPSEIAFVRARSSDLLTESDSVENLDAIARATLADKEGAILARTVARGIAKYAVTEGIKKENKVLGWLANIFTAATEKSDTRSWVSLPRSIHLSRLTLPPGEHDIVIEAIGQSGRVIKRETLEAVQISAGKRTFLNHRIYQ
jgi:hypothetical protein